MFKNNFLWFEMFTQISKYITIEEFISQQGILFPKATGDFTQLMHDFTSALRDIAYEVRRAGINDILGMTSKKNVHGEQVRKIDEYANTVIINNMMKSGKLCCMISEESKEVISIPEEYGSGKYILAFDPLDGSSNIDVNITIGTIFSLYKRTNPDLEATISEKELLQPGNQQIAAGYALYGSSTLLVYTTGNGVNVFALDPEVGDFILIFENVKMPDKGRMYSCNEGNYYKWDKSIQEYITYIKTPSEDNDRPYNFRYVASAVADIHRLLHYGGLYLYPSSSYYPKGKIRLLYEANPLAWIVEQAGGRGITGKQRILDIEPSSIHDTIPFFVGSKGNIDDLEKFVR